MHAALWKWLNKYLHVYFLNCILWGIKNPHTFTLFSLIWSCTSDLSSHLESDALGGLTARIFNTRFSCVRAPFIFSASGDWSLFIKRIFSRFAKHFWKRLTAEKKCADLIFYLRSHSGAPHICSSSISSPNWSLSVFSISSALILPWFCFAHGAATVSSDK